MRSKKDDLPAMPFYTGDWFKAGDVRSLPLEQRGLWIDMLFYMWESNERGYLVSGSGEPYTLSELSRMIGLPEDLLNQNLNQMESKKIFSVRESDGAIYCRRMVRDQQIREIRKNAGKLGGNPNLVKGLVGGLDNQKGNQNTEYESENENEIKASNKRIPDLEDVKTYFSAKGYPAEEGESFFNHFAGQGWVTGSGMPITNWRLKAENWHKDQRNKAAAPPQETGKHITLKRY